MNEPVASLLDTLPLRQRLALAYGTGAGRLALLGLLALDQRLAGIVRNSREPALAQLRLAWWREQLAGDDARWPAGDPLLGTLRAWRGGYGALAGLVDGWEAMTGAAPLAAESFAGLAEARAAAFAALAPDSAERALRLGRNWALADIAARLSHPEERRVTHELVQAQDWRPARLPRVLRPLTVLHALAARDLKLGKNHERVSPMGLLTALRAGLTGY